MTVIAHGRGRSLLGLSLPRRLAEGIRGARGGESGVLLLHHFQKTLLPLATIRLRHSVWHHVAPVRTRGPRIGDVELLFHADQHRAHVGQHEGQGCTGILPAVEPHLAVHQLLIQAVELGDSW